MYVCIGFKVLFRIPQIYQKKVLDASWKLNIKLSWRPCLLIETFLLIYATRVPEMCCIST